MTRSYTLFLALLVLSSGCASNGSLSGQMAGWQGGDVDQVYSAWGEPETSETYGSETVLIWRDRAHQLMPAGAPARWDATAVVCERMIAVDTSGRVTGWRWRGDACPSLRVANPHAEMLASK